MSYLESNPAQPTVFDYDALAEKGIELSAQYAAGDPFPHIVIDDFLPAAAAQLCLDRFPQSLDADSQEFDRAQERYKTSYQPDYLDPELRTLFYAFNSRPFIKVVENITGIKGLIPDPYFIGGGFHEIKTGGHLSVHADFNHHKPMNVERRVNMLIYLNKDWKPEYGGQLELWRTDMSERVHCITPEFNRCAMFTTTQSSMHGNPQPIAHPDGVSRKSIALYYYTATWDGLTAHRTTQFHARPNTEDKPDWRVRTDQLIADFAPPALGRQIMRVKRRLERRS